MYNRHIRSELKGNQLSLVFMLQRSIPSRSAIKVLILKYFKPNSVFIDGINIIKTEKQKTENDNNKKEEKKKH